MTNDLNKFLAQEQNLLDHLTAKVYGPHIKFEKLSALGQYSIESLARQRIYNTPSTENDQVEHLHREIGVLWEKLAKALKDNQELWEENEQLKLEIIENEEDNSSRSTRRG